jgi:hypothetical protein
MKRLVYFCDLCGKETNIPEAVDVSYGRQADGAGQMEDVGPVMNFCHSCAISALRWWVKNTPGALSLVYATRHKFLDWVDKVRVGAKAGPIVPGRPTPEDGSV